MKLDELRHELDLIDRELIALMERRMDVSREIGREKRLSGAPIFDEERERKVYESRAAMVQNADYAEYAQALVCGLVTSSKKEQRRRMNVYLVGMPGAGKTAFARGIAARSKLAFLDTDELAQTLSGRSVADMFCEGEAVFREYERRALTEAAAAGGAIVATGGGCILDEKNIELMRGSGRIVLLNKSLEALKKIEFTGRPLIGSAADVVRLYGERRERYLACADFILDPDGPGALETLLDYCVE